MSVFARIRMLVAVALLLAVGLSGAVPRLLAGWRALDRVDETDLTTLEANRFEALIASLPARGTVGYLQPDDWPGADAQRRFYAAQYALTPRIVVMGTAAEFVIAVPQASVPNEDRAGTSHGDPRLAGFVLVHTFANGLRIFRRLE